MERGMTPEIRRELAYRSSMSVREVVLYHSGDAYPICPQCCVPMDREYQHFCDRCGQRLDWAAYRHALIVTRF